MIDYSGLPDPLRPALAFQSGLRQAQAENEERQVRGALAAYAQNPDNVDPHAFATIAQWNPKLAIEIREDSTKRQQASRVADLQRRAAGGDRTALAQLAGIDLDAYDKLADNERQETAERASVVGQAALRISQLPEAQRPAAWDAAIDQLASRYPELAEYRGQYSEEALMGAIDSAKLAEKFFDLERPRYQAIPEGGTLVNTSDPEAVRSFVSGQDADIPVVASPEEARRMPPGSEFRTPDGRVMRVPGGGSGNAAGGFRP